MKIKQYLDKKDYWRLSIFSLILAFFIFIMWSIKFITGDKLDYFWISMIVALFSFAIACHSGVIAYESDEKMKDVANMNFLHALSDFELERMRFMYPAFGNLPLSSEAFLWRSKTHMMRAYEPEITKIEPIYQRRLYRYFKESLNTLFSKVIWSDLDKSGKKKVFQMYVIARQYEKNNSDETKVISILQKRGIMLTDESEQQFFERICKEYNIDPNNRGTLF